MRVIRRLVVALLFTTPCAGAAQSLLERSPNVSGDWTGAPGSVYFNFLHRFSVSSGPGHKVSNVPTLLLAAGLPAHLLAGFNYSTNSGLVAGTPNEWEAFARWAPLGQDYGAAIDLGGQIAYNNAADGIDAEVSMARKFGRARLIAAGRALSDPFESGNTRIAVAGGAALRVSQYVAVAGDVATLTDRDSTEKVAWSAGIHIAIPMTPHTFSLQASNTLTTTLQGASRGTSDVRYGFEFTIPLTLKRYFGKRPEPQTAAETQSATSKAAARTAAVTIKNVSYLQPKLEVAVGTTVVWTNSDAMPHSVTAIDKAFDSGLIQPGKTFSHTFTTPGTYDYYCVPHSFMNATVIVK